MKLLKQLLSEARQLDRDMSTERAIELLRKRENQLELSLSSMSKHSSAFAKIMPPFRTMPEGTLYTYDVVVDTRDVMDPKVALNIITNYLNVYDVRQRGNYIRRLVFDFFLQP